MTRLRTAIYMESREDAGGGFEQALSTIRALEAAGQEIVVVTPFAETHAALANRAVAALLFRYPAWQRASDTFSASRAGAVMMRALRRAGLRRMGRFFDDFLARNAIEVVIFNEPAPIARALGEHHYIVTVWDTCHREWLEFPEVFDGHQFELRERIYREILPRALAVIANAPFGVERIASLYGVDKHRIAVMPFLPSTAVRNQAEGRGTVDTDAVRGKYKLDKPFVFYPAQFWAHKNHRYLLEGLALLKSRFGLELDAAFSGSDKGNRLVVEAQARALGLQDQVHFLGFLPDEEVPALYQAATALVMPTYFGPTNLPPLEAALLGCPIVYSDLPEFREEMGEAALYCDLGHPDSLADLLAKIVQDDGVASRLKAAGRALGQARLGIAYGDILAPILESYAYLKRRWTP